MTYLLKEHEHHTTADKSYINANWPEHKVTALHIYKLLWRFSY